MAKELQSRAIAAPGFLGLNTQESSVTLAPEYALQAKNCVIDRYGRLGSRKGWVYRTSQLNSVGDANIGINLKGIHHFIDLGGSEEYLSWNSTSFFKGENNLVPITPTTTDTISAGNWRTATLNDRAYFFQEGYKPLYYTNETTTSEFKTINLHSDYDSGTIPSGSIVTSAYGRLWVAGVSGEATKVYFSDLLNGCKWGTGSAGSLDIAGVFSRDTDIITGLAAHNGYLIVFCRHNLIIFKDNDLFNANFDPTTLQLVEVIEGIGCIATDSIQSTGEDILFLSSTGVRSLGRTIQEKSQPMRDISMNVRYDLNSDIEDLVNADEIKGVYAPRFGFYLLTMPSKQKSYCFDTKMPLQTGAYRVTTWDKISHTDFMYNKLTDELVFTNTDGIAQYFGYQDNGVNYRMVYYTNHFDLDSATITKVLKKLGITVIGVKGQDFIVKVATDYRSVYSSYSFVLQTGTPYEYNIDEYGIAEYSGGIILENVKAPIGQSGTIIQFGLEADIVGAPLSLQKVDIFTKIGRLI